MTLLFGKCFHLWLHQIQLLFPHHRLGQGGDRTRDLWVSGLTFKPYTMVAGQNFIIHPISLCYNINCSTPHLPCRVITGGMHTIFTRNYTQDYTLNCNTLRILMYGQILSVFAIMVYCLDVYQPFSPIFDFEKAFIYAPLVHT